MKCSGCVLLVDTVTPPCTEYKAWMTPLVLEYFYLCNWKHVSDWLDCIFLFCFVFICPWMALYFNNLLGINTAWKSGIDLLEEKEENLSFLLQVLFFLPLIFFSSESGGFYAVKSFPPTSYSDVYFHNFCHNCVTFYPAGWCSFLYKSCNSKLMLYTAPCHFYRK